MLLYKKLIQELENDLSRIDEDITDITYQIYEAKYLLGKLVEENSNKTEQEELREVIDHLEGDKNIEMYKWGVVNDKLCELLHQEKCSIDNIKLNEIEIPITDFYDEVLNSGEVIENVYSDLLMDENREITKKFILTIVSRLSNDSDINVLGNNKSIIKDIGDNHVVTDYIKETSGDKIERRVRAIQHLTPHSKLKIQSSFNFKKK